MSVATATASGRTSIVTGGTSGIGRALAERLAALGDTVVLVGRGRDRVARAAGEIAERTGNSRIGSVAVTDLALRSEMHRAADELLARYPSIQLLVNNAGAFYARRAVTSEGLERTFALNVLAPFVLTTRLFDRMRESQPARVVQIASEAHRAHHVDFDDLQGDREFRGFRQYGRSKLELLLLTREFGRRYAGTGVTVNAVHPGFIRSGFGLNNGGATAFGVRLAALLFGKSVKHGVEMPLFVATDPSVATVTGGYFSSGHEVRGSEASNDPAAAARLWQVCEQLAPAPAPVGSSRGAVRSPPGELAAASG
jgi:NAD(P)-dependent dehydrogenase (short-subunit alcohol dehydrogenase family)